MNKNILSQERKLAVFVAGGTGGHINSALALGEHCEKYQYEILYFTGTRTLDHKLFNGQPVVHLNSQPLKVKNPIKLISSLFKNLYSFWQTLKHFHQRKPSFALGAGGYVCGPVLLAGFLLKVPVFILEQNSVMGLTNRLLLYFCQKAFVNFRQTVGIPSMYLDKCVLTGNPVRSLMGQIKKPQAPPASKTTFNIVVFGGSLGAESINQMIWNLIESSLSRRLSIKHQVGPNQSSQMVGKNFNLHELVEYEWREYFDNIEQEYQWCDMIICRSGASTVSELRIVQKPAILIPYPFHADKHQLINAMRLKEEGNSPIIVENCEGLTQNNFKKIFEFIEVAKTYSEQRQLNNLTCHHHPPLIEADPLQASAKILSEIESYVSKKRPS